MAVSQDIQEKMLEEAYSATPNYDIDTNNPWFQKVESDYQKDLTEHDETFGNMVDDADTYYKDLIDKNQQWADEQAQIQNEQTDFAIEKIEQQKEQAQKDYLKEQSGAYVDWQKQSNKYGTQAEKLAGAGLTNTGYAESSQVSMYNTYQMRVATARDALERAKLNYDNNIKEAMLANNAALAQIYADAYLKQAELALEGFQYKNQLIFDLANQKNEIKKTYYNNWQNALQQINTENAMKEDIRQYQETQKWNTEQAQLDRQFDAEQNELQRQFNAKENELQRQFEAKQDELTRQHDKDMLKAETAAEKEVADYEFKLAMKKLEQEHKNDLAILAQEAANEKAKLQYENSLKNQTTTKSIGKVTGGYTNKSSNNYTAHLNTGASPNKAAPFNGSTYDSAVNYMKIKGVSGTAISGLMTANEWSRRKNAGSTSAHVKNYSSYSAYIKAYVTYQTGGN